MQVLTTKEYHSLKRSQAMLQALEHGGVDNWEWYDEAYKEYAQIVKGKPWDVTDDDN